MLALIDIHLGSWGWLPLSIDLLHGSYFEKPNLDRYSRGWSGSFGAQAKDQEETGSEAAG